MTSLTLFLRACYLLSLSISGPCCLPSGDLPSPLMAIFNIDKINVDSYGHFNLLIVAPALAGRHRRASFRPFVCSSVRPSIRQHLTWVSCERNSSYSFAPIVLKLCMCFPHGMRMCMWIGHNCWINFCHFFDIVNLVIFQPEYIDRGYLL